MFQSCRRCGAKKWKGDPCAACGHGLPVQTMRCSEGGITKTNRVFGVMQQERDLKEWAHGICNR